MVAECGSVTNARLPEFVRYGTRILIDDGLIELKVLNTQENEVNCQVMNSGIIKKKYINIPGIKLDKPYMSEKDQANVIFADKA